jgi:hypothetical protein
MRFDWREWLKSLPKFWFELGLRIAVFVYFLVLFLFIYFTVGGGGST